MTVDFVQPCVCSIENYEEHLKKGILYGMPVLSVYNGLYPHKQFWTIWCPSCGRGSKLSQYGSAYKAVRSWNAIQARLYLAKEKGWLPETTEFWAEVDREAELLKQEDGE